MYIESESEEIKMKLVIDIPEEDYKNGTLLNYFKCYSTKLDKIIYNGTPLPKGHGRLIDADKLHQDIFDDDCWRFSGGISPNEGYSWKQVQNAPTIIEREE